MGCVVVYHSECVSWLDVTLHDCFTIVISIHNTVVAQCEWGKKHASSSESQFPAFTPLPSIHIPMDSVFDSILNARGEEERKREEAVPEEEGSPKRTHVDEE